MSQIIIYLFLILFSLSYPHIIPFNSPSLSKPFSCDLTLESALCGNKINLQHFSLFHQTKISLLNQFLQIKSTNFSLNSLFLNPSTFCPLICNIILHARCYLPSYLPDSSFPLPHFLTCSKVLSPPDFLKLHIFLYFNSISLFLSPNSIYTPSFMFFRVF